MVAEETRRRSEGLDPDANLAHPHRGRGSGGRPAFSSMPRSRRRCAAKPGDRGWLRKCGRGGATPNTSTSASPARPTAPKCKPQPPPEPATAAAMSSITGSGNRRSPDAAAIPPKPKPPMTLAACRGVQADRAAPVSLPFQNATRSQPPRRAEAFWTPCVCTQDGRRGEAKRARRTTDDQRRAKPNERRRPRCNRRGRPSQSRSAP